MSSQLAEQSQSLKQRNERTPRSKAAYTRSISKELYDKAPQIGFFPFQIVVNAGHSLLKLSSKLVVGQFWLSIFDFFLKKTEKTLEFCLADDAVEATGNSRKTVAASTGPPMNWLLLIPVLIVLRCFCVYLSIFSIVLGKGEINVKFLQSKLVAFRRYFSSVRHYAVKQYSADELEDRKYRRTLFLWRIVYGLYESIIMTTSPLDHLTAPDNGVVTEQQTDTHLRQRKGASVKKNSLNQIDDDRDDDDVSTDDDVKESSLSTKQMLEEFSLIKDSSMDPDYEPSEEPSSEDITSDGEISSGEDQTESLISMSDLKATDKTGNSVFTHSFADKSKTMTLDEQQMNELENQLVAKIMSHFKDNFNYSPNTAPTEDVFYSPIGSPPEIAYSTDSGSYSTSLTDDALILQRLQAEAANQILEITSSKKTKEMSPAEQVADPTK